MISSLISKDKTSLIRSFYYFCLVTLCSLITAVLVSVFMIVLNWIISVRNIWFVYNILLFLVVLFLTRIFYRRFDMFKNLSSKVYGVEKLPALAIFPQMFFTWLSHLVGASVGREGIGVLIGATVTSNLINKSFSKALGVALGFSVIFSMPLTGVFFAVELFRVSNFKVILLMIYASFMGDFLASYLFALPHLSLGYSSFDLSVVEFFLIIGCCVLYAFVGRVYVYAVEFLKFFADIRIFAVIVMGLLFINDGMYQSLGLDLIARGFSGEVFWFDVFLKFLLTACCVALGFQGGEVTSLFAVGSLLGGFTAGVFGFDPLLGASLGFCLVFGNATGAILASAVLMMEMFNVYVGVGLLLFCLINKFLISSQTIYKKKKA